MNGIVQGAARDARLRFVWSPWEWSPCRLSPAFVGWTCLSSSLTNKNTLLPSSCIPWCSRAQAARGLPYGEGSPSSRWRQACWRGMLTPLVSLFSCQHAAGASRVRAVVAGPWQPPPAVAGKCVPVLRLAPKQGVAQGMLCSAGSQAGCVTPVAITLGLNRHESQQERCCRNTPAAQSCLNLIYRNNNLHICLISASKSFCACCL